MKKTFADYQSPELFSSIRAFGTTSEMWENCLMKYADSPAIVYDGQTHTFSELEADAAILRTALLGAGLKAGDRVSVFAPNSYEFVKAFLAVSTSGMTAAVIPAQLDEMSLFGVTMKFSAKAILYAPVLEGKLNIAKAKGIPCISTDAAAEKGSPINKNVKPEDGCAIMFTGGTTGKSKGALLSNRAVMQGTANGCYGLEVVYGQRYLLAIPLSHVFGLIRNLLTSLYTGSALFICKDNKDLFRDIAMFRPTMLVVVPALAEMALALSRRFGKNMLGEDMKYIICGAAAVAPYLVTEYEKMGIHLCPGYGLTETANLVSGNPDFLAKPDSVGLLYPNQEVKIVDGELWLKGANLMDGYVGDPEENAAAFEDGWFKTGDLVRFDDEGFLYITGRKKELIILDNGENISPAEVEAFFNKIELVQDSQIFEAVDENGKHYLSLEVVPRMTEIAKLGAEKPMEVLMAELVKVNQSLPAYERAQKIVIRETDFVRTPSMKIIRYKLEKN
ncbi:MAG: acyl--CoA ligase [Clostridia bacterium]|nr:acyl--CoA ligase [Clostridia bacterium]